MPTQSQPAKESLFSQAKASGSGLNFSFPQKPAEEAPKPSVPSTTLFGSTISPDAGKDAPKQGSVFLGSSGNAPAGGGLFGNKNGGGGGLFGNNKP